MFGQLEICLLESVGLPGHYNGTTLPYPNKQTNKSNPQRSYKMALILIVLLYFGAPKLSLPPHGPKSIQSHTKNLFIFLNHVSTFSHWNASKIKCLILVFRSVLYTILICFAILGKRSIRSGLYLLFFTELGFIFKEKSLQPQLTRVF